MYLRTSKWFQVLLFIVTDGLALFDLKIGPKWVFHSIVDQGVIAVKRYSTSLIALELEPHHQMI